MKRLLIPAAVAAVLAIPGTAAANGVDTARADCAGFTFNMPRGETGTVVTATRNGERAMDPITVTVFGAAVRFFLPSPDQTITQSWRILVDGPNGDQVFTATQTPCVAVTTTAPTTTAPTTSSTVAVTTPPVPTSTSTTVPPAVPTTTVTTVPGTGGGTGTVVTTPRVPATTPTTWVLPETGSDAELTWWAVGLVAAGSVCALAARRKVRES